ncbi:MAG: hypothetical protein DWQ04_17855 [Chloroflexi bacterium]|nr:MAG: hypothetical protein DWQ04_17855 [Chloroflexota bacterium]
MSFIFTFLFVVMVIISAFMQAEDNHWKNIISPALTAFCGLLILIGALISNVPFAQGITLFIALILLAASDFMFERSVTNENLFPIAMVLGVISGFTIGILFNVIAFSRGAPWWIQGVFVGIGIVAAVFVYRYLEVDPVLNIAVYIYLVQAVILLAGGLSSLYVGNIFFAIWGVFIFLSDSLVGLRAFPSQKRPLPRLIEKRILFSIIVLYYAAQYALVAWAL